MTHRHVEARTIRERDNDDFPTEFEVRSGFRRDPFTGYFTPRDTKYAWRALGVLALIVLFVVIAFSGHPHMVVPQ